jgi:hypothetical protein
MAHKFNIGDVVNLRPGERSARAIGGTFQIIDLLPEGLGEPIYRLKHVASDLWQVAKESELTKR